MAPEAYLLDLEDALRSRPDLAWVLDAVERLLPSTAVEHYLLDAVSDLCDAGHVHLDVSLWAVSGKELVAVSVAEEHDDVDEDGHVETSLHTSVRRHPLDTVQRVDVLLASRPDGAAWDASVAVIASGASLSGHSEPFACDNPDCDADHGDTIRLAPADLIFSLPGDRVDELSAFADRLLEARDRAR